MPGATYRSHSIAAASSGDTGFSVAAPDGVTNADYQWVAIVYASSSGNMGATPPGWALLDNTAGTTPSDDTFRTALYEISPTATAAQRAAAFAMTFTSGRVWLGVRGAYQLPAGSEGRVRAVGALMETTRSTNHATPAVSTTAPDSTVIVIGCVDSPEPGQTWTGIGSGWTLRAAEIGGNANGEREAIGFADRMYAAATSNITTTMTTGASDNAGVYAIVLEGVGAASNPPDVSAGADTSVQAGQQVTLTGTNTGGPISTHAWTLQSGPGVTPGTPVGSAAQINWTAPSTTGAYVLRYTGANADGSDFDDVTVTVTASSALVAPGTAFDFRRWHLTLPTQDPGDTDAEQIDYPQLATYADPNFYLDAADDIVFRAPVDGYSTSGESGATRSELREHEDGSYANSAWNPLTTARRQLTVTCRVDGTSIGGTVNGTNGRRQEVIFAQIHGATGTPPIYLTAEWTSSGNTIATPRVRVFVSGSGLSNFNSVSPISPSTDITVRIRVEDATLKMWCVLGTVDALPPVTSTPHFSAAVSVFNDQADWYFKHGAYNKTLIGVGATGEARVTTSYLQLLQPGDPESGPTTGPEPGRWLLAVA